MVRGSKNVIGLCVCLVMAYTAHAAFAISPVNAIDNSRVKRCLEILRDIRRGSPSEALSRSRSNWNVEGAEEVDYLFYDEILTGLRDQVQPRFGNLDQAEVEELFQRALDFHGFLAQLKLKFKEVTGGNYELVSADPNNFPVETQLGEDSRYRNFVVEKVSTQTPVLLVSLTNNIRMWKRGGIAAWLGRSGDSANVRDYKWEPVR